MENNNKLLLYVLGVTVLGVLLVLGLCSWARETHSPYARFVWTPSPNAQDVIGYGVIVKQEDGSLQLQTVTPTCSVRFDLTWRTPIRVAVLPITKDWKVWTDYQSDFSDTSVWNQVGLEIIKDGEVIKLKTAPVPSELQSSTDLGSWQPEGTINDSKTVPMPSNAEKYWRIVR